MLDITTNNQQASSNFSYCSYGIDDDLDLAAELLDEDMMDPLFDEDWLHDNNLDLLFDLFEEEIESKTTVESSTSSTAPLFGTSPVTSYLFGTSPSLASTLDLLYFDNQPPTPSGATTTATGHLDATTINNSSGSGNSYSNNSANSSNSKSTSTFNVNGSKTSGNGPTSITNAMRIKRGLKRGQSEGVSLLAKPISGNSAKAKNNSDKTSAKITNFKNSIIIGDQNISSSGRHGIDINYSKQSQQHKLEKFYRHNCQQHIHYITGRAVLHEHAYAVRGH